MLTIKQITDDKEGVIRGLEKKHFSNAKEVINAVLETNNCRKRHKWIWTIRFLLLSNHQNK